MVTATMTPVDSDPAPDDPASARIDQMIQQTHVEAEGWLNELLVTISRASAISGLKESQIRYYEELEVLKPATTSSRVGASRLYSVDDLRRLRALALLTQAHYKAAEAAAIVKQRASQIDQEPPITLATAMAQERTAVADGFFLARIISQIIEAIQAEIERRATPNADPGEAPQVVGLIYPGQPTFSSATPSPDEVAARAEMLCKAPSGALVALCPPDDPPDTDAWAPELLDSTGSDSQTLLFYSHESRPIADLAGCSFTAYIPAGVPQQTILIALSAPLDDRCTHPFTPPCFEAGRATLINSLLHLTHAIFDDFRTAARGRGFRYRSDGFPRSLTRASYAEMLKLIRQVIFPGDQSALAVLLVPDGLDQPTSLSILAHDGYDDSLLSRAKIELHGEGQGLSGRAYIAGEPYVSLQAAADRRIRYAHEEHCTVALAVPLSATWGGAPFGVLYLASRRPGQCLESPAIFSALMIGSILSELLGRWWLTRLRKQHDRQLQRNLTPMLAWLDSLDAHGPGFRQGIDALVAIWQQLPPDDSIPHNDHVALAVLDINHYRELIQARSTSPFPIYAQQHVTAAVQRVLSRQAHGCYWFGNDHALVIIERVEKQNALPTFKRIADQVAGHPVQPPGRHNQAVFISISCIVKEFSLHGLRDLGDDGVDQLRRRLAEVIDVLRTQAGQVEPPLVAYAHHGSEVVTPSVFLVQ